jgi:hypothetical protein
MTRTSRHLSRTGTIFAMLAIIAGCAGPAAVDGWPIGAEADCGGARAAGCQDLIDAATAALSQGVPGHPAIVSVELHEEGTTVDAFGRPILMTRSILLLVARFVLADGTVRAVGVGDSPGGPVTVLIGP